MGIDGILVALSNHRRCSALEDAFQEVIVLSSRPLVWGTRVLIQVPSADLNAIAVRLWRTAQSSCLSCLTPIEYWPRIVVGCIRIGAGGHHHPANITGRLTRDVETSVFAPDDPTTHLSNKVLEPIYGI